MIDSGTYSALMNKAANYLSQYGHLNLAKEDIVHEAYLRAFDKGDLTLDAICSEMKGVFHVEKNIQQMNVNEFKPDVQEWTCCRCGECKSVVEFRIIYSKQFNYTRRSSYCNGCQMALTNEWRRRSEKHKSANRAACNNSCAKLDDRYIKWRIKQTVDIAVEDITKEMIEERRSKIIAHRNKKKK